MKQDHRIMSPPHALIVMPSIQNNIPTVQKRRGQSEAAVI